MRRGEKNIHSIFIHLANIYWAPTLAPVVSPGDIVVSKNNENSCLSGAKVPAERDPHTNKLVTTMSSDGKSMI